VFVGDLSFFLLQITLFGFMTQFPLQILLTQSACDADGQAGCRAIVKVGEKEADGWRGWSWQIAKSGQVARGS
jgi:hypothetical protein